MKIVVVGVIVFAIAVLMTMTGRGGGNFYVPVLVATGQAMHHAATSAQFILMLTAFAGMLVFQKNKLVDWKLALLIDPPTDIMALVGGYYSHYVSGIALKLVLAGLLVIAGFLMLVNVKDKPVTAKRRFGYWRRDFHGQTYVVNLWLTIPITALAGLAAGAVGISCGSFKVPLMVLLCGVPMSVAVGTSSAMVAATAIMGFAGHTMQGHFDPHFAVPIACVAVLGGLTGGRFAIRTKSSRLKKIFAYTTLAAALFMACNALFSK
ncbi:MAG: sulfite exporter TauE/SafE family protein [Kiritimatiellae bacterium]|nr:sulfite exporter TauE/SafE family protein [Kiritimatiellia bacterium]